MGVILQFHDIKRGFYPVGKGYVTFSVKIKEG